MATGGRKTQLQVVHEISGRLGFGSGASGVFASLPLGSVLNMTHVAVQTAFNSTTNTLSIGYTVGGGQVVNAIDLKTVARTDTAIPVAQVIVSADIPLYWTLAFTGAAPTAGDVTFWIDYLPGIG